MSITLETATEFWRLSGGEYDQRTERAIISIPSLQKFVTSIAGQALLDGADGQALAKLHERLRAAEVELTQLRAYKAGMEGALEADLTELPISWSIIEKKTCYCLTDAGYVVANLVGPHYKENAAYIAKSLETMKRQRAAVAVPDGWHIGDSYSEDTDRPAEANIHIGARHARIQCYADTEAEAVELRDFIYSRCSAPSHSQQSAQSVPDCVRKVCEAWSAHVVATEEYNREREKMVERQQWDDWNGDVNIEYQLMNDTSNAYHAAVRAMIEEISPMLSACDYCEGTGFCDGPGDGHPSTKVRCLCPAGDRCPSHESEQEAGDGV